MTAIINDLRPGIGWLVLAVAGVLIAGIGLMLAVLPFEHRLDAPRGLPGDVAAAAAGGVSCPTPAWSAFDDRPPFDDVWFAHAPGTVELFVPGACIEASRWRLGLGVFALVAGSAVGALASRRPRPAAS